MESESKVLAAAKERVKALQRDPFIVGLESNPELADRRQALIQKMRQSNG